MASYCDPADLGRYGINAEALDDLTVEEKVKPKIREISGRIDSYLRAHFALPLSAWGDDIRGCCAIISAWEVVSLVRGLRPGEDIENNPLYKAAQQQWKWLAAIAGGTVHPDVTDSSPGAQEGISLDQPAVISDELRGWSTDNASPGGALPFQGRRRQ